MLKLAKIINNRVNTSNYLFEEIICNDYHFTCHISKEITNYLFRSNFLYCATLSKKFLPHITPVIYSYEMNNCSVSFLIAKQSKVIHNLRKNPLLSLTTDVLDKKNPSMNTHHPKKNFFFISLNS